jgi:transcriptional repressor NrdR
MMRACEKLPSRPEEPEAAAGRGSRSRCHEEYDPRGCHSVIGALVMEELRQLNQVAYVRFASVYREFRDVSQFLDELKPILDARRAEGG